MERATVFIPIDRRLALATGEPLPESATGSVLFADVSGFTPMTELLVRRLGPRRGPEALTRQLNQVYDALIVEVHHYRGSIIGFSGDAITCWFDSDTGARATACSLAMQEAMQQFRDIEVLPGERMSLAMKTAVAVGPVRRFLVGNPEIQCIDVLAGKTLERMAAAEHLAERGEVVLDPAAFAALQDRLSVVAQRHDEATGDTFVVIDALSGPVDVETWPTLTVALPEEQVCPWLFRPVYERLKTEQGHYLAEIRPAVPIFLRFGGIEYDSDPAAGEKLDSFVRWIQAILARYEGFLIQLTVGDKGSYLYSVFGAPIAHDDDPLRAVTAALEMLTPPPELGYIQNIQIGVTRGQMRTGAYGSATRSTYGVLGDEVNLAARLMTNTEPGTILVSQRVVNATEHSYECESKGAIQVKGKSYPIEVSVVKGRRQTTPKRTMIRSAGPLVGRDAEIATMEACLHQALGGAGHIIRLEGSAGMGKSYLAAECAIRAARRGVQVFPGACQSISKDIPYTPWRQIFRAFFALSDERPAEGDANTFLAGEMKQVEMMLSQINPEWMVRLPLLGDVLGLPIPDNATTATFDPRLRQEALFALLVELLQTWAHDVPMLLLLEDVHWMDEPSLKLTLALSRVLPALPMLLLLVHRPPLSDDHPILPELELLPNHTHINLSELSPEATSVMIANRLQGQPTPLALSLILAKTQGNPFFTEELVDAMRESGALSPQEDQTWSLSAPIIEALEQAHGITRNDQGERIIDPQAPLALVDLGIPDTVHGTVLSRIDRLPEEHKLTLKVASVIGRVFLLNVLSQSHPSQVDMEALLSEFTVMESRDFTFIEIPPPQPVYMFKHNVTQEVAYGTLLEVQQQALHQAVAETIERVQPDAVEQLAYHFGLGGVRDKTIHYLDRAARKAQHDYANETALRYYGQALALDERWEWHKGRVEVLHILGRREEEQAALRALEASPGVPAFESAYLWGQYDEAIGDYVQAQEAAERALAASRAATHRLNEVRSLNQLGMIAYRRGDYEQAIAWYNQVVERVPESLARTNEETWELAHALDELGALAVYRGHFDEGKARHEQALALNQAAGNRKGEADALNSLAILAFTRRNLDEAIHYHHRTLDVRREMGDRVKEGVSLLNLGIVTRYAGDYHQASEYLAMAQHILDAAGDRWEQVNVLNELGILSQELGDLSQAQDYLQHGLNLSREIGDEAGQSYILVNLGAVKRDMGDLDAAETLLHEGLTLAEQQADAYLQALFLTYLSMVSLLAQQYEQAVARATSALVKRRNMNQHLETSANFATLAAAYHALGDTSAALDYARQGLAILDACGGEGPEYPHQDYFTCYQVLTGVAQDALQSSHRLVMKRADTIRDPGLRQSYLERVAIHRAIVRTATERD